MGPQVSNSVTSPAVAGGAVALRAQLTISEAPAVQRELVDACAGDGPLTLDGAAVERIDTAGLQLLVALAKSAGVAGRTLRWTACSPALAQAAQRLGLARALQLPEGI